jgi:hypothetical protein
MFCLLVWNFILIASSGAAQYASYPVYSSYKMYWLSISNILLQAAKRGSNKIKNI